MRNSCVSPMGREGGGEKELQVPEQGSPAETRLEQVSILQPWRSPRWSKWLYPEGTVAHGEPTLEQVYPGRLQPMERTLSGAGPKCEEEGAAESTCYGLTTTAILHPPALLWVENVEELGMKE